MNLSFYTHLVQVWYTWGCFVALALTILAAFWIFYDAGRREQKTMVWKALSILNFVFVLPSLLLWMIPGLATGSLAAAVELLAYVGLVGGILPLISLPAYVIWSGRQMEMQLCPTCNQPLHPTWDYCPYCAQQEANQAPVPPPPASPPPTTPDPASSPFSNVVDEHSPAYEGSGAPPLSKPVEHKTEQLKQVRVEELAWLIILSGPHTGKEFRLDEDTSIGRSPARSDVVVDDGAVSRHHAKVKLQDGVFVLYDLGSTGGTFVKKNESEEWKEVDRYDLSDGDHIKLGRVTLGFLQVTKVPQ